MTGGEDGLGGITRPTYRRGQLRQPHAATTALVAVDRLRASSMSSGASTARRSATCWSRSARTRPRARFVGYPTSRYKLLAFVVSATLTGLAGMLLLFNNRMTSADPISVCRSPASCSAMVVIGGMRSFLGPALGALFFVMFRDYLSSVTENWLLYFGLLFVAFIVFSPTGLVGVAERAAARRSGRSRSRMRRWRRARPARSSCRIS